MNYRKTNTFASTLCVAFLIPLPDHTLLLSCLPYVFNHCFCHPYYRLLALHDLSYLEINTYGSIIFEFFRIPPHNPPTHAPFFLVSIVISHYCRHPYCQAPLFVRHNSLSKPQYFPKHIQRTPSDTVSITTATHTTIMPQLIINTTLSSNIHSKHPQIPSPLSAQPLSLPTIVYTSLLPLPLLTWITVTPPLDSMSPLPSDIHSGHPHMDPFHIASTLTISHPALYELTAVTLTKTDYRHASTLKKKLPYR